MKIDDIRHFYEKSEIELQIIDGQHYALGQLIKVMDDADRKYRKVLSAIKTIENNISKFPANKLYYENRLGEFKKLINTVCEVRYQEEIKVSWWSDSSDDYSSSRISERNHNWESQLDTFKRRQEVLQRTCSSLGIGYEMLEEKDYSSRFDSTSVNLYLTFQVPISMLENTQQLDVERVKIY